MIQHQTHLQEDSLDQVVERIFASRRISRSDQQRFMSTLLARESITAEEQRKINQVFDALQQGRLRVVD